MLNNRNAALLNTRTMYQKQGAIYVYEKRDKLINKEQATCEGHSKTFDIMKN